MRVLTAGALLAVVANLLLFFLPLYARALDPDSSTASFERSIAQLRARPEDPRRDVLVLGDSRVYAGLDPAAAGDAAGGRFSFLNAGIPGTTPRCWYYYDRAIDPAARRYRAVVVPVDSYADDTSAIGSLDADDHATDLHYVVFHVGTEEILPLARSFPDAGVARDAALGLLLRGPLLRADAQALLADPAARLRALAAADPSAYAPDGWHPFATSLAGLRVDFARDRIDYPPDLPPGERAETAIQVLRHPEASPSYAAYRERWLGPIVARYRAAGVPVVFVRLPTRPAHRTAPAEPSGTIRDFALRYGATLLPQAPYVAMERPDFFADHDHLTRAAAVAFSRRLGADVARALAAGPARAPSAIAVPAPSAGRFGGLGFFATIVGLGDALRFGVPIPFQSIAFAAFFALVALGAFALPVRARTPFLLAASAYFYARWNAAFLAILAALTISDYAIARAIGGATDARVRRRLLACGIAANLAFLGVFKYFDFFLGSAAHALGLERAPLALAIAVPVGISFHTFQSISYLVDVSAGRTIAVTSLADYALYLSFFPQLLSGPIVRAKPFFAELARRRRFSTTRLETGLPLVALGLAKKLAIADRFGASADRYFGDPAALPGALAAWEGTFAFAMQIYFDFSGYSDIAIGCARVLGFDFPRNFERPYFATSVTGFWRRWHMTLSSWLRDYLYIPLGGNRHGAFATYRNLLLTMLLAGLWHGAAWTFVAWGGYHGVLLALERRFGLGGVPRTRALAALRWAATFVAVTIGWVLFRASSFHDVAVVVGSMLRPGSGALDLAEWPALALAVAVAVGLVQHRRAPPPAWLTGGAARAVALSVLLLTIEVGAATGASLPFVYFKF